MCIGDELGCSAVGHWLMSMGFMLRFKWVRVFVLDKEVFNVAGHGEAGCALGIVPGIVHASKFCTRPISRDGVVLL